MPRPVERRCWEDGAWEGTAKFSNTLILWCLNRDGAIWKIWMAGSALGVQT